MIKSLIAAAALLAFFSVDLTLILLFAPLPNVAVYVVFGMFAFCGYGWTCLCIAWVIRERRHVWAKDYSVRYN